MFTNFTTTVFTSFIPTIFTNFSTTIFTSFRIETKYYQSFQVVKETIIKILNNANPGVQTDKDHQKWYRELFDPSVSAGILKASDLAGYRNNQVYIGGSKHVPLSVDAMRDAMPILFELLEMSQKLQLERY
jgi:hypothetical protein